MPRRRSSGAEVVTIYWRDIPAQVNGQSGRERHQVLLSARFQRAVDRAKRKARIVTAEDDVAQWNRRSRPCDDHVADAEAAAAELESAYTHEYLGRLAFAGGYIADLEATDVDGATLRALEELHEQEEREEQR